MKAIARLLLLAGLVTAPGVLHAQSTAARTVMPPAEQNQLIAKFCTVCHTEATPSGGLSLEHFDAAHPDPSLTAMLRSKAKNGAFGAAGVKPIPDLDTQDAFYAALEAESAHAAE